MLTEAVLVVRTGAPRQACVRLLDGAVGLAPFADPRAALAAHEQEVGTACRCIPTSTRLVDDRYHQLSGALIGVAGVAVAPDVGTSLRPHLDDVLAKLTAGEGKGISPAKHILPSICVHFRRAPLPIGELATSAVFITCAQKFDSRETLPRYVGITRRQDDLEAAQRGGIAAAIHDLRNRCKRDCAGAGGALRRGRWELRLRGTCKQQEAEHRGRGRREGCQSSGGGGGGTSH